MTVTTNPGFEAQAATGVYTPAMLVRANFTQGTLYLTPYGIGIDADVGDGGVRNFKGVTSIKPGTLRESEDGTSQKTDLTLNGVATANLALAMGSPETYQNRRITMWLAMLNPADGTLKGAPVMRFNGIMEAMKIDRASDPTEDSAIIMTCRSGSYSDSMRANSVRMTNRQHQQRYPGDRGLEFVSQLIARPQVWLTKRFQEV